MRPYRIEARWPNGESPWQFCATLARYDKALAYFERSRTTIVPGYLIRLVDRRTGDVLREGVAS